ncbi:MAG: Asp-tRNA(Asn)/Glu-tRNA(Gln) amidotransferase subunit GatC [Syntrophomonadaceae bacterium]|nr:Asp-tRNA(Asn)/Glu-tRNA(Gln) amidotransferase subunit GatC [Syntrophomonadaceae bacterium]
MSFTVEEVEKLALLAKIDINEDIKLYADQLNLLLNYVSIIKDVNTDNVEPLIYILPNYNVFRADEIMPSIGQDKILQNATVVEEGYFKVPKII